jgi:ribosomal protein S18 acetylase RimI-like enzyme
MRRRLTVRRLAPGDERVLALLARDDEDFDIADRGKPRRCLSPAAARAYLKDPHVLHWVAERDGRILGHVYFHILRKRAGDPLELLLYEIGVRAEARRDGVGRALLGEARAWMRAHRVREAWVLADNPGAVRFYRACGYRVAPDAPTYLTLTSSTPMRHVRPRS